jgi:hypothetical protein
MPTPIAGCREGNMKKSSEIDIFELYILRYFHMRSVVLIGFLVLPLLCSGQEAAGEGLSMPSLNEGEEVLTVPELKKPVVDRIHFGLEAGAVFSTFGRQGSMYNTYIAPEIRYQAAPRLHFSTGIILSTGFAPFAGADHSMSGSGTPGLTGNRFNRVLFFAEGSYQLNPRLTIGGMVIKELENDFHQQMNAFQKNSGFQSVGMSVGYKISDNIHVGARLSVTDGRPYYFTDPANPFILRSPYGPVW